MAAIGLKGGVQLSESGYSHELFIAGVLGVVLSLLLPLPAFWFVSRIGKLDRTNAGAIAAHYGSVSVVTFVTGVEVFEAVGLAADGFMVAVMALMEAPAILVGIWLARAGTPSRQGNGARDVVEAFSNGSIILLVGSFSIGLAAGREGFSPVAPLFEGGFKGMLCLFLLDMGLVAGRQLLGTRCLTPKLVVSAVVLAVFNGVAGVVFGTFAGLEAGSAAALGILAGSASYIAAPAAVRLAIPTANVGLPLAMSLGVTFPFNIMFGIPAIIAVARWLG